MHKRPADDIPRILAARDRTQAGRTAHPDGLYLMEVRYPPLDSLQDEEYTAGSTGAPPDDLD